MKEKKCLVIETSSMHLTTLQAHVNKYGLIEIAGVVDSYANAISFLTDFEVDIVFLSPHLPDKTELLLASTVEHLPPLIILAANGDYAVESYRIGKAVDYLVHPFNYERFCLAVSRATASLTQKASNLAATKRSFTFLRMGRRLHRFDFKSILFIEAYTIYIKIHTLQGVHVVNETISSVQKHLDSNNFVRVHKSYIVSLKAISIYSGEYFWIGEQKIPVGISYKKKIEEVISSFL